ncbi:MAG: acetolactate decarboxylase [Candidatus Bathyarchaeia archaeon]
MNGRLVTLAALGSILVIMLAGLYLFTMSHAKTVIAENRDILFQLTAFNTFSSGKYDGTTSFSELAKHGDFDIGTVNGLDGEMIALDSVFYQVPINGIPVEINPSILTPYATVTFFDADKTLNVNDLNYSEVTSIISQALPEEEAIYAIKITGTFDYAKTRSVPAQTQPYPPLSEAVKQQTVFDLTNVSGTIVGFYFPQSMSGVDFAGYHMHFLTENFSAGGHLLDCTIRNATIEIDYTDKYTLILQLIKKTSMDVYWYNFRVVVSIPAFSRIVFAF